MADVSCGNYLPALVAGERERGPWRGQKNLWPWKILDHGGNEPRDLEARDEFNNFLCWKVKDVSQTVFMPGKSYVIVGLWLRKWVV
ncbi:hypothetical protein CEXT_232601 [Caerostris extrusa]|uniref:Uncharacterized protein n=1 Tax=Caerostris extrusa TaxID=172846 RepID=A0AAV4X745_CAEEX|nr:hypothetical protein CEXT_232601 [Caerostris extrusa]